MLNIIFFGPPNAGKGTQAKIFAQEFGLIHMSTGDILREERANKTELGLYAQSFMDRGDYVPDEVILKMVANKIEANKSGKGFLFDGFPRTLPQAEALDQMLSAHHTSVSGTVNIEVPEDELLKRMIERSKREKRADDTPEVLSHRLQTYFQQTLPVLGFYEAKGKQDAVNGLGLVEEVTARLRTWIQSLKP